MGRRDQERASEALSINQLAGAHTVHLSLHAMAVLDSGSRHVYVNMIVPSTCTYGSLSLVAACNGVGSGSRHVSTCVLFHVTATKKNCYSSS